MINVMEQDIKKVLISEEEIQAKVAEIGARISEDYVGKKSSDGGHPQGLGGLYG